ncbi:MAG TPA: S9 family peptidase [Candidatus Koribacter sp.]|jgi:dipeptidyl aminopeptidase/acylaminoacyl peptidase
MRSYRFSCIVLLTCCGLCFADGPDDRQPTDPHSLTSSANPSARPVPVDDLFYSRSSGGGAWSPDGKEIAFSTDMTGNDNVWKMSASGSFPIQMSYSRDTQTTVRFTRDGKWITYAQDAGGNEQWQLISVPVNGGAAENHFQQPDAAVGDYKFSPDGSLLAIVYKSRTASNNDIALLDWNTHQVKNVTNEKSPGFLWSITQWFPDGKHVLANRMNPGFTNASVYRIDVETGAKEELTPHEKEAMFTASSLSPDGHTALIDSNQKTGSSNIALLDIATKKITWVTDTGWETNNAYFSPDGKRFTYQLNKDGRNDVFLCERTSVKCARLNMPEGLTFQEANPSPWSPDGTRLLLSHQSSRRPSDLWVYDVRTNHGTQLTNSALASLNPESLPQSQIVHYKSFDGKMISALVWMPPNLKRDGSNPAIVLPHGGPTGQTTDYFNADAAALASRGYICIAPNVRGSTGYGIEFQKANYQDLGGGDLKDEVAGRQFLIDSGYVDAKKVGITGGSYGGFMTLIAIGKTPDLWAAAVELYGIIDWYTMMQHEDPFLQEYEKSLMGDPVKDKQVFTDASPIKYIRNEKAPLLVLQGENDIRVPKEEAEQIVDILKKEGHTVDVHYYPEEGHGFRKRENRIDSLNRTVNWFNKYLKNEQ